MLANLALLKWKLRTKFKVDSISDEGLDSVDRAWLEGTNIQQSLGDLQKESQEK